MFTGDSPGDARTGVHHAACYGHQMCAMLLPTTQILGYTTMESDEFHTKLKAGFFGVLIDTRRRDEWEDGHLPNATFLEELHKTKDVSAIAGCEACNVGVYCHSGARSKSAADVLEAAGFKSVYDVLGIVQWQAAGHSLLNTASTSTACSKGSNTCAWPNASPSLLASAPPPASPLPPPPLAPPPVLAPHVMGVLIGVGAFVLTLAVACGHRIWSRRRHSQGK